jgi:hypothetical protein
MYSVGSYLSVGLEARPSSQRVPDGRGLRVAVADTLRCSHDAHRLGRRPLLLYD